MGSRRWRLELRAVLHCENCRSERRVSNGIDPNTVNIWELDSTDREWLVDHCRRCGLTDHWCECDEPQLCSAVDVNAYCEDPDSIPF